MKRFFYYCFYFDWAQSFAHSKDSIVRTCSKVPARWWTGILSQGNREAILATLIFLENSVFAVIWSNCNLYLTYIYQRQVTEMPGRARMLAAHTMHLWYFGCFAIKILCHRKYILIPCSNSTHKHEAECWFY